MISDGKKITWILGPPHSIQWKYTYIPNNVHGKQIFCPPCSPKWLSQVIFFKETLWNYWLNWPNGYFSWFVLLIAVRGKVDSEVQKIQVPSCKSCFELQLHGSRSGKLHNVSWVRAESVVVKKAATWLCAHREVWSWLVRFQAQNCWLFRLGAVPCQIREPAKAARFNCTF